PRESELRLGRRRQHHAPRRRAAQGRGEGRPGARAVQRRRAGGERSPGRASTNGDFRRAGAAGPYPRRQAEGARRHARDAHAVAARRADHRRDELSQRHFRQLVRPGRPRRHARRPPEAHPRRRNDSAALAGGHRAVRQGERSRIAWHAAGLRRLPRRRAGEVEPGRVGDRFQGTLGMLIDFFLKLKSHKLPVSIKEYLTLLEAMQKDVIGPSIDDFYYLSRTVLVKDESNFDKFDRAFGEYFQGVESVAGIELDVPLEWLLRQAELNLSDEEKAMIEAMGGWEKLMETLKKRLEEQKARHQGGNKWIGTAGTSPFGAYGYNPEGIRIGQDKSRNRSAVKVLMFLDIGGTMDDHIKLCEELFSAAKTEFKHLEYFYFHNCLYDYVWKDNRRRHAERTRTFDIMHKYGHDYKLVFVGDATM